MDYGSPSTDLGYIATVEGLVSVRIPDGVPGLASLDGDYLVAASAYDDWGNESDIGEAVLVPFDFVPPAAPGAVTIT